MVFDLFLLSLFLACFSSGDVLGWRRGTVTITSGCGRRPPTSSLQLQESQLVPSACGGDTTPTGEMCPELPCALSPPGHPELSP